MSKKSAPSKRGRESSAGVAGNADASRLESSADAAGNADASRLKANVSTRSKLLSAKTSHLLDDGEDGAEEDPGKDPCNDETRTAQPSEPSQSSLDFACEFVDARNDSIRGRTKLAPVSRFGDADRTSILVTNPGSNVSVLVVGVGGQCRFTPRSPICIDFIEGSGKVQISNGSKACVYSQDSRGIRVSGDFVIKNVDSRDAGLQLDKSLFMKCTKMIECIPYGYTNDGTSIRSFQRYTITITEFKDTKDDNVYNIEYTHSQVECTEFEFCVSTVHNNISSLDIRNATIKFWKFSLNDFGLRVKNGATLEDVEKTLRTMRGLTVLKERRGFYLPDEEPHIDFDE